VTLHPLLARRTSPRSFVPDEVLAPDVERRLLEAVRWSPSAANTQPWRLLVARNGTPEHADLLAALAPGNSGWARDAAALVLLAATTTADDGSELPWAVYDTGQAAAHLTLQACAEGLAVHQMGGFDADHVQVAFGLAEGVRPMVVLAVGRRDDPARLPTHLADRETAPRTRLELDDILIRPVTTADRAA
jgi:nitroreductase